MKRLDNLPYMWQHENMKLRRPDVSGDKVEQIRIRISQAQKNRLRAIAEREGVTMSVLLRRAMEELEAKSA